MDRDGREELVVILAGLFGVLIGQVLRRARREGGGASEVPVTAIGTSTLVAAPALGRIAGDALSIERRDTRAQAALSFLVGCSLTLFADDIGRYFPGNRLTSSQRKD